MAHLIYEPAASAILGNDGAPVLGYSRGLTNEKFFGGEPFSRLNLLATSTNGEVASVSVRGEIAGLTTEAVQDAARRLAFVRVKFTGLVLEVKGDGYNTVEYRGTAEKAELVSPLNSASKT